MNNNGQRDEQNHAVCRVVTREELPQVKKLWELCFEDTATFVQWYFEHYWNAEHTLGIFSADENTADGATDTATGHMLASAQVIPYRLRVRGTNLFCGYIVGVNTAPEARNRGYAKRLLQACLRMQRENGQAISLLMPFEGQFYYRYGWSFCYFHQRAMIAPNELRCAAKSWGTVRRVDLFEAQNALQQVYHTFVSHYHGMVDRTDEQWYLQLQDAEIDGAECFLIADERQQVQGYFLWMQTEEAYVVREIAWCHEQAKNGMLYYLMQHVPEGYRLQMDLPEDDSLKYGLAASKTGIVLYPFLMARIVDVQRCLELLRYDVQTAELLLTVQDAFAQWNTGNYHMVICDGAAKVQSVTDEEKHTLISSGVLAVAGSADGLSRLVMGAETAEMLLWQGVLQCAPEVQSDVAVLLGQLWPKQCNYINEYY